MPFLQDKKILVLHPFLNFHGGAEYQLSVVVNDIFPQADIFAFACRDAVLQKFGIARNRVICPAGNLLLSFYKQATPIYPAIIDSLDVTKYDVVLSFSYAYVHGVVTNHNQLHVAHIETPMRLLWLHESEYYWYNKVPFVKELYQSHLAWQRLWDKQAAQRPDVLLANSNEVAGRISHVWGRDALVVYPPVDTEFYARNADDQDTREDFYVTHSRLVRYKRVDLLIEAAKKLKRKLVVIGDGPEYRRLKKVAGNNKDITFTGYISDTQKRELLLRSRGYWAAAYEDFGISTVEAMAAGLPVFAYGKGGSTETVTTKEGVFFDEQSIDSIVANFNEFEKLSGQINANIPVSRAKSFSKEEFIKKYTGSIQNSLTIN